MHRYHRLAILVAVVALSMAACGPNGRSGAGKTPDQAVHDAMAQAQASPLRATFTSSDGVDRAALKNIPKDADAYLDLLGVSGKAKGCLDRESPSRSSLCVTINDDPQFRAVQYDGKYYVVDDRGTREVTSSALPYTVQLVGIDLTALAGAFSFHDAGAETQDNRHVQHYSAPLDSVALQKLAQVLGARNSQIGQFFQLAIPFSTIDNGSLDVWVAADDDSLVRVALNGGVHIDVGSIAQALAQAGSSTPAPGTPTPTGKLGLTFAVDLHVTKVGSGITVSPPQVTASAPRPSSPGGSGGPPSPTP